MQTGPVLSCHRDIHIPRMLSLKWQLRGESIRISMAPEPRGDARVSTHLTRAGHGSRISNRVLLPATLLSFDIRRPETLSRQYPKCGQHDRRSKHPRKDTGGGALPLPVRRRARTDRPNAADTNPHTVCACGIAGDACRSRPGSRMHYLCSWQWFEQQEPTEHGCLPRVA